MKNTHDESEIQNFFRNTNVFLTGGTGFIGQVLSEKLLRSCSIKHLYLLTRSKKGRDPQSRLNKMFSSSLYQRLSKEQPDFINKITLVIGDCNEPNLGLSPSDEELIIRQVNIVFHCAASIHLNGPLQHLTFTNVRSTRDLLVIAKKMTNLKSFVYVSTAFANTNQEISKEIIYKCPMKGETLISMAETMSESFLNSITKECVGTWPNTYTFSKCIAENLVQEYGKNMPITIARPSIVVYTHKEPIPGWFTNLQSVPGLVLGVALGAIHVMLGDPNARAVIVPADKVANMIMSCAWFGSKIRNEETPIPVFNYVPNNMAPPLSYGQCFKNVVDYIEKYNIHSTKVVWIQFMTVTKSKFYYNLLFFLCHYLPAFFIDIYLWISGKKLRVTPLYSKLDAMLREMGTNFACKSFKFDDTNLKNLISCQNDYDKQLFDMDLSNINWHDYFLNCIYGARSYVLNYSDDEAEVAAKKYQKMKVVYRITKGIMYLIIFYLLYKMFYVLL
ncbi:fatty acyl-CoA reductase wat-like [Daktulosphaira vitifoliae]|uniref:fatty acyl-CoA reductase wat-like n=1 Tax=Daktulosphaira vitifoliae TaxID=58002 RepID=UPI0021A99AB0|nr:fatty acyl-CoA reductase wat-like [Daktulosphaira vitifoliae]